MADAKKLSNGQLRPWCTVGALLLDWGLIFSCFAAGIQFPHFLTFAILGVIVGRTQLALAVMMHEAAHGLLFKNRVMNDFFGQVMAAAPLSLSLYSYRQGHLQHHQRPMVEDDPIVIAFGIGDYPVSKRTLVLRLARDFFGISFINAVWKNLSGQWKLPATRAHENLWLKTFVFVSIASFNVMLFGAFYYLGSLNVYFFLWLLPALSWLQVFGRIRAITEHAGYGPSVDQSLNARTICKRSWQTFFFGPHSVHYHIEHHQHAGIPFYNLKKVHKTMLDSDLLPKRNLYSGYGQVLKDVTTIP